MKYGFKDAFDSKRPKELQERLDTLNATYRKDFANLCKIQELVDVIQDTELWKSSMGTCEYTVVLCTYAWPDLYIRIYQHPIDDVITGVGSALHQKFGILWTMHNSLGVLELRGKDEGNRIDVYIQIFEGENVTCRLIKTAKEVKKVDNVTYEYKLDCQPGE